MSDYDELKKNLQKMYEAAKAELVSLDEKRVQVLRDIEKLAPFVEDTKPAAAEASKNYSFETLKATSSTGARGRKTGAAKKAPRAEKKAGGRRPRVKEEVIRDLVVKYLKEVAPNSMTPVEIFARLVQEGLPETPSFRTRVYGKLGAWSKTGFIVKIGRGVYQLPSNS